jgi:hypothetical protein
MYFKTLASSTYVGFHEGPRQFIYKVFTRKYVETKKNYLQECMLNTGGVTHTLTLVTESKITVDALEVLIKYGTNSFPQVDQFI